MKRLVFPAPLYDELVASLRLDRLVEAGAVVFVVPANSRNGEATRYLAREFWTPTEADYLLRTIDRVKLSGTFILRALVHAQQTKSGVVFVHSHPSQWNPEFSSTDDEAEHGLAQLFADRAPARDHFSVVVGIDGAASGRLLGTDRPIFIQSVGIRIKAISQRFASVLAEADESRYDRQIKALTRDGQAAISKFRVAIIGLGGTGSHVAQQLAYLGFSDLVLVDPDKVDVTNTNRVAGASAVDIDRPKVEVARDMILAIRPGAHVECIKNDVVNIDVLEGLRHVDAIMICTDSHGSRAVLNRLAYQFLIPAIDLGSHMAVSEAGDVQMLGRVQLLAPGLACLHCYLNVLDANLVRLELLHPTARARDPYGFPPHVVQPAVVSINGVVSSLAVTMLLQTLTTISGDARSLRYDAVAGRLREAVAMSMRRCPDCARQYSALGDNAKILARSEEDI